MSKKKRRRGGGEGGEEETGGIRLDCKLYSKHECSKIWIMTGSSPCGWAILSGMAVRHARGGSHYEIVDASDGRSPANFRQALMASASETTHWWLVSAFACSYASAATVRAPRLVAMDVMAGRVTRRPSRTDAARLSAPSVSTVSTGTSPQPTCGPDPLISVSHGAGWTVLRENAGGSWPEAYRFETLLDANKEAATTASDNHRVWLLLRYGQRIGTKKEMRIGNVSVGRVESGFSCPLCGR